MKFRVSLCALLLGASLAVHADNRVHTVQAVQSFGLSEDFDEPGRVAIDGNFANRHLVLRRWSAGLSLSPRRGRGVDSTRDLARGPDLDAAAE